MKNKSTDDMRLQAEIYSELINDMQAKIFEFEKKYPNYITDELVNINSKLSAARMESRIYVDEDHFKQWEDLLCAADATMIQNTIFR